MKKLLSCMFLLSCFAQAAGNATLSLQCPGVTTVTPPQTISCTGTLSGVALPAALQGTISISQATGTVTVTAAGTSLTATKTVAANGNTWEVSGVNQTTIVDGTVIAISIPIPVSVTCSGTAACLTLNFSGLAGSDPQGGAIAVTAGPSLSVSVSGVVISHNLCDLNGDGLNTLADRTIAITRLLSNPPVSIFPPASPVIGDVQKVTNAMLPGGTCNVGSTVTTVSLASLACPAVMIPSGSPICTVSLSGPASTSTVVTLAFATCDAVTTPATVTVSTGSVSAIVPVTVAPVSARSCTILATLNGITQSATFTAGM